MSRHQYSWYADDKDIHDILLSSKRKVITKVLLKLARQRGIFLSPQSSREQLAQSISLLNFDRKQIDNLLMATSSKDRTEKMTSAELITTLSLRDMLAAVELVKEKRAESTGELYQVRMAPTGDRIVLDVQYTEIDEALTRLSQKQLKEVSIEIESTSRGVRIRHPASERAEQIITDLQQVIEGDVEKRVIVIFDLDNADKRTRFFIDLINNIDGYKYSDATITHCERMNIDSSGTDEDEDSDDSASEEEQAFEIVIRKIALEGSGLLNSDEYKSASRRGLFISRIAWKADDNNAQGNRVEFEAEFASDGNLRYGVRGIYKRKKNGHFNQTKVSALPEDQRAFYRMLEAAAQTVYDNITREPESIDALVLPIAVDNPVSSSSNSVTSKLSNKPLPTRHTQRHIRGPKRFLRNDSDESLDQAPER